MQYQKSLLAAGVMLGLASFNAQAQFIRETGAYGAKLVYDTVNNLTWMQDANYLGTLAKEYPAYFDSLRAQITNANGGVVREIPNPYDTSGIHPLNDGISDFYSNGLVTWWGAKAMAGYLNYNNYGGSNQWVISPSTDSHAPGYNYATTPIAKFVHQLNSTVPNNNTPNPFSNVQSRYWTNAEYATYPQQADAFFTTVPGGFQGNDGKSQWYYAWAATAGNIGTVLPYRYAEANTLNNVVLGNQRVGGTATQVVALQNTAANDGHSELLAASISASGPITASGSVSRLMPGAVSNNLKVGVDTGTVGHKTGTATMALVSDGTGSSYWGNTELAPKSINVSGDVYRQATPETSSLFWVNFGAKHVGDVANTTLTIRNTAANDGYSEKLGASFGGVTGTGVVTNGAISAANRNLVAAGGSNSTALSVGIDTTTAGAKGGTSTVNYVSDGTGTSGLAAIAAGSKSVSVSGDVYNYAAVGLQSKGGAGTLSGSGLDWTLDFGSVLLNTGDYTANLEISNTGPASIWTDLLDGRMGNDFLLFNFRPAEGFGNFSDLKGGDSLSWQIALDSTDRFNLGSFSEQLYFNLNGHNASGYNGALGPLRLTLLGNVVAAPAAVPLPGAVWMFLAGMMGMLGLSRRKQ